MRQSQVAGGWSPSPAPVLGTDRQREATAPLIVIRSIPVYTYSYKYIYTLTYPHRVVQSYWNQFLPSAMLALKKKREAEAAQKAAEEQAAARSVEAGDAAATTNHSAEDSKVNLLGIGGRKVKTAAEADGAAGKKRTPGEIRIQKGTSHVCGAMEVLWKGTPEDATGGAPRLVAILLIRLMCPL